MKRLLIVGLLLSGCGGISIVGEEVQSQVESKLPSIPSDQGQLCICRVYNFARFTSVFDMKANGEDIGRLSSGSYFCINLEPDEYIISTKLGFNRASEEVLIRPGVRKYMDFQFGLDGLDFDSTSREVGLSCINSVM